MGVEAGFLQKLQADAVRLLLVSAGEVELLLYRARLHADNSGFRRLRVGACGEYGDGDGCHGDQAIALLPSYHARYMALGDVRNLVAQHRGQFRFALCGEQQPCVYADIAARHGKGVDGVIVDREELEIQRRFRAVLDQPGAQLIEVIVDLGIVQVLLAGANLQHALPPDLAFL